MCPVSESAKLGEKKQIELEYDSEPKGDPEMAPLYLKQLLPVFCKLYQRSMIRSVRYVEFFYKILSRCSVNCCF